MIDRIGRFQDLFAMLKLPVQLTHADATRCVSAWLSQLPMGTGAVQVHAGELERFDSSALAALLALRRTLLERGQSLELVATPPRLKELASLYGVQELLAA